MVDELKNVGELEKAFAKNEGFILMYRPKKSTCERIMIHRSSCKNNRMFLFGRYDMNPESKLGKSNKQEYFYDISFDELIDFAKKKWNRLEPKGCSICKPSGTLT